MARELMDNGWSLKHVHRLILTSSTYQQSNQPREDALQADAATEWWWRFPPRRLEAEPIRDSILAVTGVLDTRMYGPGFSGFEVELENVRHYFPKLAPHDLHDEGATGEGICLRHLRLSGCRYLCSQTRPLDDASSGPEFVQQSVHVAAI